MTDRAKLGTWLFNLGCKLNPAIPVAMTQVAEAHAQYLLKQALAEHAVTTRLALHQEAVAQRASRQ